MGLAFEQLPKESAKAFAAFSEYLNMGPERSLAAVGGKLGKSKTMLGRWCKRFDWPGRVQAHAAHLALVEREATERAVREKADEWLARQTEQREEEWKLRNELLEAGREALRRWRVNASRCGSLEGIARMLELASRLGRLAAGMPLEVKQTMTRVEGKIDVDWRLALAKVFGEEVVIDLEETEARPGATRRDLGAGSLEQRARSQELEAGKPGAGGCEPEGRSGGGRKELGA